jgi:hypothetical protein
VLKVYAMEVCAKTSLLDTVIVVRKYSQQAYAHRTTESRAEPEPEPNNKLPWPCGYLVSVRLDSRD